MLMSMEQVDTQLQQELFTLRAQVAAESGLADAVRAINNLATAQVRKDWRWAAEEPTDITTTAIELEFLPTATKVERGVENLECVLQQMHTALMALASYEAHAFVAISRKNLLEALRRLQKSYDSTIDGRNRRLLTAIISLRRCSLLELQAEIDR